MKSGNISKGITEQIKALPTNEKLGTDIGKRIQTQRDSQNLTQEVVAAVVGVKRETLNQWESGTRQIKAGDLLRLAIALDCTVDYLVTAEKGTSHETAYIAEQTELTERAIEQLNKWAVMARLWDKHKQITNRIITLEQSLKESRNDNPREEYIRGVLTEEDTLKMERDALEKEMLPLIDGGEGYFKPLQWQAPIGCQRARQRLDALNELLTREQGETALNEIGEYFYMGEIVDGYIRTANETAQRRLTKEDISIINLTKAQTAIQKVREELSKGV
jgi:transcriptional regulator with XRE-family HTH domain